MVSFRIPEISCPFQSSINPCIEQVRSRMQEWLQVSRLVQDEAALQHYLERVDVPSFACRFHAKAALEDMLLCSDWYSWAFVLDDVSDDGSLARQPEAMRLVHEHLLDVFHNPALVSPQGPIAHSLSDFWQRLRQRTSAVWQKRFVQHHTTYFAGQEQEAEHRRHNHVYDMSTYIENRRNSIGAYMCFDLLELTQLVDISTEVYESQPFQSCLRAACDVINWTNDLYSVKKELAHGDTMNNLVLVLQHAQGCSLQEAAHQTCVMIEAETQRLQEMVLSLPSSSTECNQNIGSYLMELEAMVAGNLAWARNVGRYREVEYTKPGESSSYVIPHSGVP